MATNDLFATKPLNVKISTMSRSSALGRDVLNVALSLDLLVVLPSASLRSF